MSLRERLRKFWCDWTHCGGRVKRDPNGRINWQCDKCGRWAEPVPPENERQFIDAMVRAVSKKRKLFVALPRGLVIQVAIASDYKWYVDGVVKLLYLGPKRRDANYGMRVRSFIAGPLMVSFGRDLRWHENQGGGN